MRLSIRKIVMKELEKIFKRKNSVSLETKVKIIQIAVLPMMVNGCDSWTMKKAAREIIIH